MAPLPGLTGSAPTAWYWVTVMLVWPPKSSGAGWTSNTAIPSLPISFRPEWTPVEKGAELFTVQDEKGFKAEPRFTFDVALAAPYVLRGEPVVKVLRNMADEAQALLNRLIPLA